MIDNFIFSASVVMPLFMMLSLGYFLRHINIFTDEYVARTNKISFKVFLPAMLLVSIVSQQDDLIDELDILKFGVSAVLIIVILYMVIVPFLERDNPKRGSIIQASYRSSILLYGIPIVYNIYGGAGLAPVAMITVALSALNSVVTVIMFSFFSNSSNNFVKIAKQILKDIIINPLIIAAAIGLVIIVLDIRIPFLVDATLNSLSAIAAPLALLALGGSFRFSQVIGNLKYLVPVTFIKMLIHPLVVAIVAVAMGFEGPGLAALVITFASPVAISSQALAQEMGGDSDLAGQITVSTTMVSCFTIFIFIYVLNMMNLL